MKYISISLIVFALSLLLSHQIELNAPIEVANKDPFMTLIVLAFLVQWLAFIPASIKQTEKFYDLTGSITYLSCILFALFVYSALPVRAIVITIMVSVWALRLGSFLFLRIKKAGKDVRFDEIKKSPSRFFVTWTLQGLWVTLTSLAAWTGIIYSYNNTHLGLIGYIGVGIWLLGFSFEVIADRQKSAFKADPNNEGKFIQSGLWARCRHPNYFGEIVLWIGMFIMNSEVMFGWAWLASISPVFVYFLLTKISGVPLLTERAKKTWGDDKEWQEYYKNTPALIPKIF